VTVSYIGRGNRGKTLTCRKSLTNFDTVCHSRITVVSIGIPIIYWMLIKLIIIEQKSN